MSLRDHIVIAMRREVRDDYVMRFLRNLDILRRLDYVQVHPRPTSLREFVVEGDIGECLICQEEFKLGETFIPLPCNPTHPHKFHKACIMPWLQTSKTCPTCRGTI